MDDLVERLRDDETFVRQRACHNCTKGFENHEYHCTRGPRCIDGEDVLKACRKRWRSERKEAAAEITRLRAALETARRDALKEAAFVARSACLVEPDGGSPTDEECAVAEEAARRIRALIQPNTSPF